MEWIPEGFRTADEADTTVRASPGPASTKAVKIAWIVALVYGGFVVGVATLSPFLQSRGLTALTQSVGQGVIGIFYLSLGLAVRRGDRFSIWCLVALQTLEVGLHIWVFGHRGILLPISILILFIRGALHLQRSGAPIVDSENWTHVLYEVAFLQATVTVIFVAWSSVVDSTLLASLLGRRFDAWQTVDVVILIGLGIAVWKRQVWAGYALLIYQIGNTSFVIMGGMNPYTAIGIAFLYGFGAFHLHRLHGPMTKWGRAAVALVATLVLPLVVSTHLEREATVQRITAEGKIELELEQLEAYREVSNSDPGAYERIKEIIRDGIRKGQSVELIGLRISPLIAEVATKYLPQASDDALVAFGRLFVRRIEKLTQVSSDLCYQYLFPQEYGTTELLKHMSYETLQEEQAVLAAVIRTAAQNPQPSPDAFQSEALLEPVYIRLYTEYGDDLLLLDNPLGESVDKKRVCTIMAAVYKEVLDMPKKERGIVLRHMFSSQ